MLCVWVRSVSTKVQQSVMCVYNAIGVYRIDAYVSVYTRLQSSRVALVCSMLSGMPPGADTPGLRPSISLNDHSLQSSIVA